MSTFTPPQIGTKLGELNLSFKERLKAYFTEIFVGVITFHWRLGFVLIPIGLGYILIAGVPFNPEWASISLGVFLCLVGLFFAFIIISTLLDSDDKKTTVEISVKKSYSLFLVKNGIEIESVYIPFQGIGFDSLFGIESFKVDGDYLRFKTIGQPYLKIEGRYNENGMKFKIEPKYNAHKEELLAYLNFLIDKNQQQV
jgi:hypothetical protein